MQIVLFLLIRSLVSQCPAGYFFDGYECICSINCNQAHPTTTTAAKTSTISKSTVVSTSTTLSNSLTSSNSLNNTRTVSATSSVNGNYSTSTLVTGSYNSTSTSYVTSNYSTTATNSTQVSSSYNSTSTISLNGDYSTSAAQMTVGYNSTSATQMTVGYNSTSSASRDFSTVPTSTQMLAGYNATIASSNITESTTISGSGTTLTVSITSYSNMTTVLDSSSITPQPVTVLSNTTYCEYPCGSNSSSFLPTQSTLSTSFLDISTQTNYTFSSTLVQSYRELQTNNSEFPLITLNSVSTGNYSITQTSSTSSMLSPSVNSNSSAVLPTTTSTFAPTPTLCVPSNLNNCSCTINTDGPSTMFGVNNCACSDTCICQLSPTWNISLCYIAGDISCSHTEKVLSFNLHDDYRTFDTACMKMWDCFDIKTIVETDKRLTEMQYLKAGDMVKTPYGMEPIIGYLPTVTYRTTLYVEIVMADNRTLAISDRHRIIIGEKEEYIPASKVKVGQKIRNDKGQLVPIMSIRRKVVEGYVNPHTPSGTIYANGYRVSQYAVDSVFGDLLTNFVLLPFYYLGVPFQMGGELAMTLRPWFTIVFPSGFK
ncbi:hypothetical protein HDV06_006504 [Boothiomyces sp. JEL0866]|nr:hypothetical protein HDV06_006504 [Boothiomyces sp. JEL0866]